MKLRKRVQKFRKKLSYFCNGCNKKHIKKTPEGKSFGWVGKKIQTSKIYLIT